MGLNEMLTVMRWELRLLGSMKTIVSLLVFLAVVFLSIFGSTYIQTFLFLYFDIQTYAPLIILLPYFSLILFVPFFIAILHYDIFTRDKTEHAHLFILSHIGVREYISGKCMALLAVYTVLILSVFTLASLFSLYLLGSLFFAESIVLMLYALMYTIFFLLVLLLISSLTDNGHKVLNRYFIFMIISYALLFMSAKVLSPVYHGYILESFSSGILYYSLFSLVCISLITRRYRRYVI